MEWRPSRWGQRVTRSPDWQLRLDGEQVALLIDGRQYRQHVANEHSVRVVRGVLWSRVELTTERGEALSVDGLPNSRGSRLAAAVQHVLFARSGGGARHCLSTFWRRSVRGWPRQMRLPTEAPPAAAGSRTNSSRRCWPTAPPCPSRQPSWSSCSSTRSCTTICTRPATAWRWTHCTTGSWIGPPCGRTPMRQWRPANWVWPSPSGPGREQAADRGAGSRRHLLRQPRAGRGRGRLREDLHDGRQGRVCH